MSVELLPPPVDELADAAHAALAADEVISQTMIAVAGRAYVIQPVTAARLGLLGNLILREVKAALGTGMLDLVNTQELFKQITPETEGMLDATLRFWELLPVAFGKALALILSAEAPDDATYLTDHLTAPQLFFILNAFWDVNAVEDLVESFFRLRDRWQRTVARLQGPNASTS
jgi:hypothetical protein